LTTDRPALEVGRVKRAVGIKGEVVVRFYTDHPQRTEPGTVYETGAGPRTLTQAHRRPDGEWTVRFEGVADRTTAEGLRGPISGAPIDDPDELWVHDLIGAVVVDQTGTERGTVKEVRDGVAADLLVLDTGHLVPVTFVENAAKGRIDVDVPEGLFDL
jgi:16S rRNA processing protein RimM